MGDGRPSDDFESVHIAKAVNAAARIERRAHDLQVPVSGSPVQRVGVVSSLAEFGSVSCPSSNRAASASTPLPAVCSPVQPE